MEAQEDVALLSAQRKPHFCTRRRKILSVMGVVILLAFVVLIILLLILKEETQETFTPVVVGTWSFSLNSTNVAYDELVHFNGSVVDALVEGLSVCENDPDWCGRSVGYGTKPSEIGETTLDAMIMHNNNVGAVGNLHRIREASQVARGVLELTEHTLLVGRDATQFAELLGFQSRSLSTAASQREWDAWRSGGCQPNYWANNNNNNNASHVYFNCSALGMLLVGQHQQQQQQFAEVAQEEVVDADPPHDTIGMIVVNENGEIAAGTSTSGLAFRIPGRVGDSPIPGSGAYAETGVGGCVATGAGDYIMRVSPCALATFRMNVMGWAPAPACYEAGRKVWDMYGRHNTAAGMRSGALVCVNSRGQHGAVAWGMDQFQYSVRNPFMDEAQLVTYVVDPTMK